MKPNTPTFSEQARPLEVPGLVAGAGTHDFESKRVQINLGNARRRVNELMCRTLEGTLWHETEYTDAVGAGQAIGGARTSCLRKLRKLKCK